MNVDLESIRRKLLEINTDIADDNIVAKSFYLNPDESGDIECTVIWITEDAEQMQLDQIDVYCEKAFEALKSDVDYVLCVYRNQEDYREGFEQDAAWQHRLVKVEEDDA